MDCGLSSFLGVLYRKTSLEQVCTSGILLFRSHVFRSSAIKIESFYHIFICTSWILYFSKKFWVVSYYSLISSGLKMFSKTFLGLEFISLIKNYLGKMISGIMSLAKAFPPFISEIMSKTSFEFMTIGFCLICVYCNI